MAQTTEKTKAMTPHERLNYIQQNISVSKDRKNEYGGFVYRHAEDILNAVKPLLGDFNIAEDYELKVINDDTYLDFKVWLVSPDGKQSGVGHAIVKEPKEDLPKMSTPQTSGAVYSYARKYALGALFGVADNTDDPDSKDNTKQVKKPVNAEDNKPWLNAYDHDAYDKAVKFLANGGTLADIRGKYKISKEVASSLTNDAADYLVGLQIMDNKTINDGQAI